MWKMLKELFQQSWDSNRDTGIHDGWSEYAVDESGLSELSQNGDGRKYPWTAVKHIGILTTSDGPWCEDVFFIIKTDLGDICITHAEAQKTRLLEQFKVLPGFNYGQVVSAMASTSEASFACWDRSWSLQTPHGQDALPLQ